jgi:transposase
MDWAVRLSNRPDRPQGVTPGRRDDLLTTEEREEIRKLRREVFELRRTNEILKAASLFFAGELDPHRPR